MEMMEATNGWLVFSRGNNDRVNGWGVMREYMKTIKMGEMASPRLIYFKTCKNAIRTIPALVHDETKVEDVDSEGDDHAGDCDRYLLMEINDRFSEKPKAVKKIRTAGDIFERDMEVLKEQKLEQEHNIDWMSI